MTKNRRKKILQQQQHTHVVILTHHHLVSLLSLPLFSSSFTNSLSLFLCQKQVQRLFHYFSSYRLDHHWMLHIPTYTYTYIYTYTYTYTQQIYAHTHTNIYMQQIYIQNVIFINIQNFNAK